MPNAITDLQAAANRIASRSREEKRASVKIAIIDDQPLTAFLKGLVAAGFKVTNFAEITSVSNLADYGVVVCDIKDVGLHLFGAEEGFGILLELQHSHPEKVRVLYTAYENDDLAKAARPLCDAIIRKGDVDDALSKLDSAIGLALDPVQQWNRVRLELVRQLVPAKEIAKLEANYAGSVRSSTSARFLSAVSKYNLSSDARAILQNLAASALWQMLAA